jgi:hypothetical protein
MSIAELAIGGIVVRKGPAKGLAIKLTRARNVADGELDIVLKALPNLARHDAKADALIGAHLILIVGIVHVGEAEGEDVASVVARRADVSDGSCYASSL